MTPTEAVRVVEAVQRLWPKVNLRETWGEKTTTAFTDRLKRMAISFEQADAAVTEYRMVKIEFPDPAKVLGAIRAITNEQQRVRTVAAPRRGNESADESALIDAHNQRTQEWLDAMPDDELAEFWVWVLAKPEARQLGMHKRDRAFLRESPFVRGVMFAFAHPPMELGR